MRIEGKILEHFPTIDSISFGNIRYRDEYTLGYVKDNHKKFLRVWTSRHDGPRVILLVGDTIDCIFNDATGEITEVYKIERKG